MLGLGFKVGFRVLSGEATARRGRAMAIISDFSPTLESGLVSLLSGKKVTLLPSLLLGAKTYC
jgi:hypothetical protein